jgi:hypothetical protein
LRFATCATPPTFLPPRGQAGAEHRRRAARAPMGPAGPAGSRCRALTNACGSDVIAPLSSVADLQAHVMLVRHLGERTTCLPARCRRKRRRVRRWLVQALPTIEIARSARLPSDWVVAHRRYIRIRREYREHGSEALKPRKPPGRPSRAIMGFVAAMKETVATNSRYGLRRGRVEFLAFTFGDAD